MRRVLVVSLFSGLLVSYLGGQTASYWRQGLSSLPAEPPPSTSPADVARFEHDLQLAAPYFARIQPNDYEANRLLARQIATYMAGLQLLARDPQMRRAIGRAQRAYNALPLTPLLAYSSPVLPTSRNTEAPQDGGPPQQYASQAPFSLSAPDLKDLSSTDQAIARDLCTRYEGDAAHASGVWQNAETLRLSLAARGMALNTAASTSLARLPIYFKSASDSLRQHNWEEARTNLSRAESETEKITKVVGR